MPKILRVTPLQNTEISTLEEMHKNHPAPATRRRVQGILLNNKGYKLKDIASIHNVRRQTVSCWIKAWESDGLAGLVDNYRDGRPKKLTAKVEKEALKYIEEEPRNLSTVIAKLKKKFGIDLSKSTIKRFCKRSKLSWKRVRKSLKSKRDPVAFEEARQMVEELVQQELEGNIDLYFFDESGFTLVPSVPYAWQPIGERIKVPCSRSQQMNVLGFINKSNQFQSFVFEDKIDSSIVIHCFEEFLKTIDKPTYIVTDNAPIHKSDEFMDKIEEWSEKNLFVKFLSPYSPELNIIEILWKKIKYEWIPFSAYESYELLKDNLFNILGNIGKNYFVKYS